MVYLWSVLAGLLVGFAVGVGAARMFKAPKIQGMGAFRTLGELNACNGDPIAHFSFGLGFFLNSAVTAAASGALTEDVCHRVIPNWAAAILTFRKKRAKIQMLHKPTRMGLVSALVGAAVIPAFTGINYLIPSEITDVTVNVIQPAVKWLLTFIMPAFFFIAAIGTSKSHALMGIIFGFWSQFIFGNALAGIVLGILAASIANEHGYKSSKTWTIIILIVIMLVLAFYLINLDPKTGGFLPSTWENFFDLNKLIT